MRTRKAIIARVDEMGKGYETNVLAILSGILETQLDIRDLLTGCEHYTAGSFCPECRARELPTTKS